MLGMLTAAVVRESEDIETRPCLPLCRRTPTTGENGEAIATVVGTAGADIVTAQSPLHRLLRWQRVDSLERGGAVSAAASPPPSVFEQDISLGPAQDDSLSSEDSRGWRPRHGSEETHSEVVAASGAREAVTAASRSTPREAESMDCGPPPWGVRQSSIQ